MTRPAAVLLDCDGVLVDSEGLTNRLLVEDFARHGLHLSLDEVAVFSFGSAMVQTLEPAPPIPAAGRYRPTGTEVPVGLRYRSVRDTGRS